MCLGFIVRNSQRIAKNIMFEKQDVSEIKDILAIRVTLQMSCNQTMG